MYFNIEHGTELIVRKKLAQFIEKYFRYLATILDILYLNKTFTWKHLFKAN